MTEKKQSKDKLLVRDIKNTNSHGKNTIIILIYISAVFLIISTFLFTAVIPWIDNKIQANNDQISLFREHYLLSELQQSSAKILFYEGSIVLAMNESEEENKETVNDIDFEVRRYLYDSLFFTYLYTFGNAPNDTTQYMWNSMNNSQLVGEYSKLDKQLGNNFNTTAFFGKNLNDEIISLEEIKFILQITAVVLQILGILIDVSLLIFNHEKNKKE